MATGMTTGKIRKFNGKKFALLSVSSSKGKARTHSLKEYGYTRVVKVKGGYALYFRSYTATN